MTRRRALKVLTSDQLSDGYAKAIETSLRLLSAALTLAGKFPEIALGLAEIGQEELGKSLSLLAAFQLPSVPHAWAWFWCTWSDHQLKGHRAFLYELLNPTRLEMEGPGGTRIAGPPSRASIKHEKEAAFYVNFDSISGHFRSPQEAVVGTETYNRVLTLLYLAVTASHIEKALRAEEELFRLHAFSEIAFRICSESLYQQDMPAILLEFEQRSDSHKSLVRTLRNHLSVGDEYLKALVAKKTSATPSAWADSE